MAECRSLRLACLNGLAAVLFLFSACAHASSQSGLVLLLRSRNTRSYWST
jgi:hypothetical protein